MVKVHFYWRNAFLGNDLRKKSLLKVSDIQELHLLPQDFNT